MSSGILEKLFGSAARIKVIRLFLLNPENLFTFQEISRRAKVASSALRREILLLKNIGFIKEKTETVDTVIKIKKGKIKNKNKKKKITGLKLDELFPFLQAMKNLVLNAAPIAKEDIGRSFNKVGKMKLIIVAGIFTQSDDSRVDVLLVGDAVQKGKLENLMSKLEAEIGRELNYAVLDTKEFMYRYEMYDKFIRDILDYPHEKLLNKLGI